MSSAQEAYDARLIKYINEDLENLDITDDAATQALKNFQIFSACRPPQPPEPEPEPIIVVPTTVWGKAKAGAAAVWDNETTRVLIKSGGAFAGVALVAWSTIKRDHVMERTALAQANQRPS